MIIDLHIHSKTCSDGNLATEEVIAEAARRKIALMSITDHDSIDCQNRARELAHKLGIAYISGVELNVTFPYGDRSFSLDFLGYGYDIDNRELSEKLKLLRKHRETRARLILEKLNVELTRENMPKFTGEDMASIQSNVDGTLGRPHIADYLVSKGIVRDRQEAFDKYLVRCDVPKYPLSLTEASSLVRQAGGILVLAHPNDPNGTSLVNITEDLSQQTAIIAENMLADIDGIECWHSRHDADTTRYYLRFAEQHGLMTTGGSDCHQKPIIMGTVAVPDRVAAQFGQQKKATSKS